ncbi:aldo/keto reductase [Paenibacillus sp. PK4536]|uniref:2,5-didehydrogluconate reductase (2-dehydro-L-gulonate-forming) n=1 Tax=Paenibacillus nuruki TaxID=1886670 RepID=A0A1E3KY57_9BACL|nr:MULTISPECIES: aldo/keto reductase [Paenibacillus]ODP26467.1 2,5-didehydrogluconate reductase (2-dehydro-L-gulonate-forming) [Paenibacillus nuruki]TKJ89146.1 aldo/keto reductase [Paenibacillus sp. CFBP13512]WIM40670.1 aldo/keto reductase [Paenibacillus sp. PK4536]CAJ1316982.1 2,5-didehydrogluconate reductase (2-dehydro-L-gulonate-forming) [Paenibacillus nuruki]
MTTDLISVKKLNNGVNMPWFGLGVWQVEDGNEAIDSVKAALKSGYRAIDTAAAYGNEESVGKAIKESGIARDELFITSKVWNKDQGYESTLAAFEETMKKLDLDVLDLYLIHWPVAGKYKDTWRAMEKLYKDGRIRAIGVSNFQTHHLDDLLADAEVVPAVNQVEFHPLLTQTELLAYSEEKGIQLEAWSPLARGKLFDNEVIKEIADKYGKEPAQVILRWVLDKGVVVITRSVKEKRIASNAEIFDFKLTVEEIDRISALNKNERTGPDPDNFDF